MELYPIRDISTLSEVGISRKESSTAKKLARIPEQTFNDLLDESIN